MNSLKFIILIFIGFIFMGNSYAFNYIEDAKKYITKGEYQAAIIQLKNQLKKQPKDAFSRHLLGITYIKHGEFLQAEKELNNATRLDPDNSKIRLDYAQVLLLMNKFKMVVKVLKPAFKSDKSVQSQRLILLGYAHLGLSHIADATAFFKQAINKNNISGNTGLAKIAYLEKNYNKALQTLELVLNEKANNRDALQLKARTLNALKKHQQALSIYHQLIKQSPNNYSLYLQRATTYLMLNEFALGEADLKMVLKKNNKNPLANFILARIRLSQKNYEQAKNLAQQVINVSSRHYPSILVLGISHYALGNLKQADKYLTEYLSFKSDDIDVLNILANVYLAEKKGADAILILSGLNDVDINNNAKVLMTLGSAYLLSGEYEKGLETLYKAQKLAPNNKDIQKRLVAGQFQVGDMSNAINELEKFIATNKNSKNVNYLLIASYIQQKLFDKAEKKISYFLSINPADAALHTLRAAIEKRYNHDQKAKASYSQALKIDKNYIPAYIGLAKLAYEDDNNALAKQHYQQVIAINNKYLSAYIALANISEENDNIKLAEKFLLQAYNINSENFQRQLNMVAVLAKFYKRQQNFSKILLLAEKLLEQYPEKPRVLFFMVDILIQSGDYSKAEVFLKKLIAQNLREIKYRLVLAQLLSKQTGREGDFYALLDESFNISPDNQQIFIIKQQFQLQNKQYKKALSTAEQAKKAFPQASLGEMLESDVYLSLGQTELALKNYQQAYQKQATSQLAIKIADTMEIQGNKKAGIDFLKVQAKSLGGDLALLFKLAKIYQSQKNYPQAIKYYQEILIQQPDKAEILNNLAWVYSQVGNPKAIVTAKRAYKAQPDSGAIADTYGYILLSNSNASSKNKKEALRMLKRSVKLIPDNAEIQFHLAKAYSMNNKKQKAIEILEKITIKKDNFAEQQQALEILQSLK